MSDMEKRVRDAFDAVHAPEDARRRALARIESMRAEAEVRAAGGLQAFAQERGEPSAKARNRGFRVSEGSHDGSPAARRRRGFRAIRAKVALAACLLLAAVGAGGFAAVSSPTAYVGIDVNPSIELGINWFGRVAQASAYNADGEEVLAQAGVEGKPFEEAFSAIERALSVQGYLAEGAVVEVSVACDADERFAAIESASMACFGRSGAQARCMRMSEGERQDAHSCGMGMGKYRAWKALSDAGVDITQEEAASMSMRELRELAADAGVDADWGCGGRGQGGGGGHGSRGNGPGAGCGYGKGLG